MGEESKAADNDETLMDDESHGLAWNNLRPTDFQKATIVDGTIRFGHRWIRCNVCDLNQPDYQVEKAQCHAACLCCGIRTPQKRCVAQDERIHQAQLNVQRAVTMKATTAGHTGHRNRWSSAATSVEPVTASTRKDTETTSSQEIRLVGDTQSRPVPRLQQLDDD